MSVLNWSGILSAPLARPAREEPAEELVLDVELVVYVDEVAEVGGHRDVVLDRLGELLRSVVAERHPQLERAEAAAQL